MVKITSKLQSYLIQSKGEKNNTPGDVKAVIKERRYYDNGLNSIT